jgi:hypothetical protein
VLAGAEEALQSAEKMSALDTLLAGLIDYAGLYPPAGLDMGTAVRNYLEYRSGAHASALGRFIVDVSRLDELETAAGDALGSMRRSVILPPAADVAPLLQAADRGLAIESVEVKAHDPAAIERIAAALPSSLEIYFEVPLPLATPASLDAIAAAGARAKLRMGGVTADAFPGADAVVAMLRALMERSLPFKATAGLHHPVRSRHRLTYAADSPSGTMHGFLNLLAAASILREGGSASDARTVLAEENPRAFRISEDHFDWRDFEWTAVQIHSIRRGFFISFGSCSFAEPMADLEALGWL